MLIPNAIARNCTFLLQSTHTLAHMFTRVASDSRSTSFVRHAHRASQQHMLSWHTSCPFLCAHVWRFGRLRAATHFSHFFRVQLFSTHSAHREMCVAHPANISGVVATMSASDALHSKRKLRHWTYVATTCAHMSGRMRKQRRLPRFARIVVTYCSFMRTCAHIAVIV